MLVAVAAFAVLDACLKLLVAHYPPAQVAALRGLVSLPLVLVWALWAGGVSQLVRVRWGLQLLRGVLSVGMMVSFSFGLMTLGLTEAYAIFFVAPLMVTALSVLLLGESVVRAQWLAVTVGFVGVLVALNPRGTGFVSLGGLAILATAVCYALTVILVKVLGRTDSTHSMMFWLTCVMAGGSMLLALPVWLPIQQSHWPILAAIAVFGTIAQYCVTVAFQRAPAASVAPLEYTALGWGIAIDLSVWGSVPAFRTLVGAGIVIAAGLLLLRHEHRAGNS
ncbi:MAG: DMT family transporter [Proteobacteria bacterium]|nr:DMT family transporter [Pseudomonadota bacterium]